MIRIAVVGAIGSGKSHVAKLLGFPIFNADLEVVKIYKKNYKCYLKLKKKIPKFIKSFPINKSEILKAINKNGKNLIKITNIVHPIVRLEMNKFIKKNIKKKAVVLDIPLYFENKIYKKKDIIIFVSAKQKKINKMLKKRNNYDVKLIRKFRNIQLEVNEKKNKSNYIIKNDFKKTSVRKSVKMLKEKFFK